MDDITIILPVRLGSQRCKLKNIRKFGNTTLLNLKLNQLKHCNCKVIISSSDAEISNISKEYGLEFHLRDPWYSRNETTGSELYECLASAVHTKYMLYTTAMCPFVTTETYLRGINTFLQNKEKYDSLVSCTTIQQFLYDETNKPLNFQFGFAPRSQDLPKWKYTNFGVNILKTQHVKTNRSLVGNIPYWFELTQLESIDIDTEFDFQMAESMFEKSGLLNK